MQTEFILRGNSKGIFCPYRESDVLIYCFRQFESSKSLAGDRTFRNLWKIIPIIISVYSNLFPPVHTIYKSIKQLTHDGKNGEGQKYRSTYYVPFELNYSFKRKANNK